MEEKEIQEILSGDKELYMRDVFRLMVDLNTKVEQLYKAHYNPPTNNDLYKTLNDLSDRMNSALGSLKRLER